jgi:hypothetical protein
MRAIAMELARTPEDPPGKTLVRVEPSAKVQNGIYIDVNDHYDLMKGDKLADGTALVDMVRARWKRADEIVHAVHSRVLEGD